MQNKLKIYFRQKQLYRDNDINQPIIVQCDNCQPVYVAGTVPDASWHDMTDYCEGLEDISLSWDAVTIDNASDNSSAEKNEIGSNYSKGITLDVRFTGTAYDYIFDWLLTDACQMLNCIECRIDDIDCGNSFRLFEIKLDNIRIAPFDDPCILGVNLREADAEIKNIETVTIEDDWQGWFNSDGAGVQDHPCFMYIVEKKPQFMLSMLMAGAYVLGMISLGFLTRLTFGQRWIRKMLGISYHCPSPYISTYIDNFCNRFQYNRNTIFDAGQPYEDLCLFFPAMKYYHQKDGFDSTSTLFIWDNRTGMPMNVFLDRLKKIFDAEWYITPNKTLVFQKRSYFETLAPIYDFTAAGAVQIYNFQYHFNGKKKPSYGQYEYQIDPADICSSDLKWRYNSIVDFDQLTFNPMLEGSISKTFDFACTSFMYDGATGDWMEDGIKAGRTIAQGIVLVAFAILMFEVNWMTAIAVLASLELAGYVPTNDWINDFFNNPNLKGGVRTSNNVVNVPRLLLKDPATPNERAKVVYVEDPAINPFYNQENEDYYTKHPAFGEEDSDNKWSEEIREIYNYPMYVDEDFTGNLFDRFLEQDNPVKNPVINQDFEFDVDMCCSMLDLFGVWQGDFMKIGSVVVLENRKGRLIKGRIEHLKVNYKTGTIHVEGTVLGCV